MTPCRKQVVELALVNKRFCQLPGAGGLGFGEFAAQAGILRWIEHALHLALRQVLAETGICGQ